MLSQFISRTRGRVRKPVVFEPSRHVEHGKLLALSFRCTLISAVLFQPALMGEPRTPREVWQ